MALIGNIFNMTHRPFRVRNMSAQQVASRVGRAKRNPPFGDAIQYPFPDERDELLTQGSADRPSVGFAEYRFTHPSLNPSYLLHVLLITLI
jgi:hypothetical protein